MDTLSVYKQLTFGTSECLNAIKREIGMKTTCIPFAVKLINEMRAIQPKTEQAELDIANTLLSGLQTLMQGGIVAEDYDKIDFVNRGGKIVPSARVEAFYRACARKGYRITDTIIAVPKEDFETTYFKENFYNGDIIYTLEDRRYNSDRVVNAERLDKKYFSKFICRLDIHDVKQNKRVVMTVCEMSIDDLLAIASASEQGIYKSYWEASGNKKRKVITKELNGPNAFWIKWTGEMVNKTIIRRALKRVKEVLPELTESIYAFEQDEYVVPDEQNDKETVIEIPVEETSDNVDLNKLTEEQKADCKETLDLFTANPKLAEDKTEEIIQMFEKGLSVQEVTNKEYASIYILKKYSKEKWPRLEGYFNEKS